MEITEEDVTLIQDYFSDFDSLNILLKLPVSTIHNITILLKAHVTYDERFNALEKE
jgi:hypothetical protein